MIAREKWDCVVDFTDVVELGFHCWRLQGVDRIKIVNGIVA